jgi:hypothetical protein
LGHLFSNVNKDKTVSRLYLFVRPKILTTTGFDDLEHASDVKKDEVERITRKSNLKQEIKEGLGRKAEVLQDTPVPEENDQKEKK